MEKNREQKWSLISRAMDKFKVNVRLMTVDGKAPSEWSSWLSFPSESYVEAARFGPVKKDHVIWVEISKVEFRKRGRLVPEEKISHADEIIELLQEEGVAWETHTVETMRITLV